MIKHKNKGFTLVEMIIVMSLTVIVIVAIFSFFIISKKISSQTEIKSDIQREAAKVQESVIDVGTQCQSLDNILMSGDKPIDHSGSEVTVNDYIDYYNNHKNEYNDPVEGAISVKKFIFKYPAGYTVYGIKLDNKNNYLKFEYGLDGSELICNVYEVDGTSEKERRKIDICENVDSIFVKPVNWESLKSNGSQNLYPNVTGLKITVKFKISKGFFTGTNAQTQSINAIVKFRNDDISEET